MAAARGNCWGPWEPHRASLVFPTLPIELNTGLGRGKSAEKSKKVKSRNQARLVLLFLDIYAQMICEKGSAKMN